MAREVSPLPLAASGKRIIPIIVIYRAPSLYSTASIHPRFLGPALFEFCPESTRGSRGEKKGHTRKAVRVWKSILSRTKAYRVSDVPHFSVSLLFVLTVPPNPLFPLKSSPLFETGLCKYTVEYRNRLVRESPCL